MMCSFKKNLLLSFLSLFLISGLGGCGGGGSSSSSGGASNDEVASNKKDEDEDVLFTGDGIIDPIDLSGGLVGTETPNVATFRLSLAFRSLTAPLVLESLMVVKQDILNGIPLHLLSNMKSYNTETVAEKIVAHIEKQAIYTGFRASRSLSTIRLEAPPNLPYKYVNKRLDWKFLIGPSRSVSNKTITFSGFSSGTASHYSKVVITLHADLPADADDHEIIIDGVTIDFGTEALTRGEIAKKIADTDFSSGDNYISVGAYYVGVSGYNLLFQRRDSNGDLDGSIPVQDNTYTGTK